MPNEVQTFGSYFEDGGKFIQIMKAIQILGMFLLSTTHCGLQGDKKLAEIGRASFQRKQIFRTLNQYKNGFPGKMPVEFVEGE